MFDCYEILVLKADYRWYGSDKTCNLGICGRIIGRSLINGRKNIYHFSFCSSLHPPLAPRFGWGWSIATLRWGTRACWWGRPARTSNCWNGLGRRFSRELELRLTGPGSSLGSHWIRAEPGSTYQVKSFFLLVSFLKVSMRCNCGKAQKR